jgi:enoyl-CoA hydratase/carnithine racemase
MAPYPTFRHLTVEIDDDGIALVTLPGEPVLDTHPLEGLHVELHDMFIPFTRDDAVKAVVVTGVGDMLLRRQLPETNKLLTEADLYTRALRMHIGQQLVYQIASFPKPFVAAVNGRGAEHFLYADAIVAAETATFGDDHHVEDGVAAGDGNTVMWPFLVGMAHARQVVLAGRRYTAREAYDIGFVQEVVEPGRVVEAGIAAAGRLASQPALPFMATKLSLNNFYKLAGIVGMDLATGYQAAGMGERSWVNAHT